MTELLESANFLPEKAVLWMSGGNEVIDLFLSGMYIYCTGGCNLNYSHFIFYGNFSVCKSEISRLELCVIKFL